MIRISVDTKDFLRVYKWIDQFESVRNSPDVWFRPIRELGDGMMFMFDAEGDPRPWQKLAYSTRAIRAERGYNPEHPILQQSGDLVNNTAVLLLNWRRGASEYRRSDSSGTFTQASIRGNEFNASLSGPKAENHFGGPLEDGYAYLPRRQFFGIHPSVMPRMTVAFAESLMAEWQYKGGSSVKRMYGRLVDLPGSTRRGRRGATRR